MPSEFEERLRAIKKQRADAGEEKLLRKAAEQVEVNERANERYRERMQKHEKNLEGLQSIVNEVLVMLEQTNKILLEGVGCIHPQRISTTSGKLGRIGPGGNGEAVIESTLAWPLSDEEIVLKEKYGSHVTGRKLTVTLINDEGNYTMSVFGGNERIRIDEIHRSQFNNFADNGKKLLEDVIIDTVLYHPGECDVLKSSDDVYEL